MSEIADLLREILDVQREQLSVQRETLAVQRRQAAAEPLADRLVQAVHSLLGSDPFTAPQLIDMANSRFSTRLDLRALVEEVVRGPVDQEGAGRKFGRFLAQNSRHEVGTLRLVSLGKSRDGFSYRIDVATQTRLPWNVDT